MKLGLLFLAIALCAFPAFVPPAADDADPSFRTRFVKLMEQKLKPDEQKLFKSETKSAIAWIVKLAESLPDKPSPEDEALLSELRETWKASFKNEFAEKVVKYHAELAGQNKKDRKELVERWRRAEKDFEGNLERKDGLMFANIVDEFEVLGGAFEQVGDLYLSSEAWRTYSACYDEPLREKAADLHRAWSGLGHAIEMREKLELHDAIWAELVKRKTVLTAKGADKKDGGGEAPTPPAPGAPGAPAGPGANVPQSTTPINAALSFEMLASIDAFARPSYYSDENYEIWPPISLKEKGTQSNLPYTEGAPPIVRVASSDVRFDTVGDGKGDEKLPITGNITPVKIMLGKDKDQRPWGFFAVIGTQKDVYQGIELALNPTDKQMQIYVLGGASVVATIGASKVRVIDDSQDGVYGNVPKTWANIGITKDYFEPWLDSIVIGASKRARPWSEIQEIDGKWYKLAIGANAKELSATPLNIDTGMLKLEFKGPAPSWVVVQGSNDTVNSFFDLVEGGSKGVPVPVGKYKLYYGEMRKGKKRQLEKTLILPGKDTPTYDVKKGEVALVELGAPFGFDFQMSKEGDKLTIKGETVCITGSKGERYERTWNCVARPEASWRKKGSKQSSKLEKMPNVADNAAIDKHGWPSAWKPLDVVLDVKGGGDKVEVQLIEKKHDLFGPIQSDWKE